VKAHSNNINILRLLAAFQVVLSHSIGHLDLLPDESPLTLALRMFPGVPIFFLLSGFLIYRSWTYGPDLRSYYIKRALRIFPALWLCFAISIAMLIFLAQLDGSLSTILVWVGAQLTIFQFINPAFLRDFGVGVLNGSLWSIPVEIQFYLLLPFIAAPFSTRIGWIIIMVVTFMITTVYLYVIPLIGVFTIVEKLLSVTVLPYLFAFGIGMTFAKYDRLLTWVKNVSPIYFLVLYVLTYIAMSWLLGYNKSGRMLNPVSVVVLSTFTGGALRPERYILRGLSISHGLHQSRDPSRAARPVRICNRGDANRSLCSSFLDVLRTHSSPI